MAGKEFEIAIKILGNLDGSFNNAISGASSKLESLGKIGSTISKSVQIAGQAFSQLASTIGGVAQSSIEVGQGFESAMSSVAATAGASEEDYKKLEAAAMEMGRSTSKTAAESANALEYMALAGWSVDESIKGLPSVLRLSEATGMDLAQCSDLVTDSMSALGVTVDDLSGYLDIAAKANNKSNQTAQQLMEAYLGVGGTMHGLGIPLEDSATALGVLANRGIKGSEAGTALNAVMVNLTTGTGQAGKMMESLGISAFDSQGNFKGLKATLEELNSALSGCTDEERNAALAAIGGKVHVDALNDLMAGLNTTNEQGVSEWDALNQELQTANGSLEEMARVKLDNLEGDMATFQSACEDCGIKIYKHMQTPLRETYQFATEEMYKLSEALENGGFSGMAEALGEVISDGIMYAAGYAHDAIGIIDTIAGGIFNGLQSNAPKLTSEAAGVVTHLLTTFIDFYGDFWSTGVILITGFLDAMVDNIPVIFERFGDMILDFAGVIQDNLPAIGTSAAWIVLQLVSGIGTALPQLLQAALMIVQGLGDGIIAFATVIFQEGPQIIAEFMAGILSALPGLISQAGTILEALLNGIVAALPVIVSGGVQMVSAIIQGITTYLPGIISTGVTVILNLLQGLLQALPSIIQAGIMLIAGLLQGIGSNLGSVLTGAIQIIVTLAQGLISAVPILISQIPVIFESFISGILSVDWIQLGKDILGAIGEGILAAITGLGDIAKSAWNAIKSAFTGGGAEAGTESAKGIEAAAPQISSAAYFNGTQAVTGMANAVTVSLPTLTTAGTEAGNTLTGAMNGGIAAGTMELNTAVTALGGETATALNTSLQANLPAIDAAAMESGTAITSGITSGIDTGMAGATDTAASASVETVNAMAQGISEGAATITETVQNLTETVKAALAGCWTDITASTQTAWSGIGQGMTQTLTSMQTASTNTLTAMGNAFTTTFQTIQTTVESAFTRITQIITTQMAQGRAALQAGVSAMKSVLNFQWKLPNLKMPHITVSGSFSVDPPKAPNFNVSWYAKGGILDGAQIFGAMGGNLLGGGESGKEAVLPLSTLWGEMRNVFGEVLSNANAGSLAALSDNLQARRADPVSGLLDTLPLPGGNAGGAPAAGGVAGGGNTYNITYAPQITVQGNADRATIDAALAEAREEFPGWFQALTRDQRRRGF